MWSLFSEKTGQKLTVDYNFFQVVSVVCDMEKRQVQCMTKTFNITPETPSFNHPDTNEPVFGHFDPPHLIKCLRNNLMNYDILVSKYFPLQNHICSDKSAMMYNERDTKLIGIYLDLNIHISIIHC